MLTDEMLDQAEAVLTHYEHARKPVDASARLACLVVRAYAGYGPAHRESADRAIKLMDRYLNQPT